MKKFWNWTQTDTPDEERVLRMDGVIAEESWFDDEVTPAKFKEELEGGSGPVTVWINSPGGDCFAAAQIYNMLRDYGSRVTVKIDSLAASAASVIAMAGDEVLISPVGMLMIHNPSTVAWGDHKDMEKAIDMLEEVKNSIINAYMAKTGMSRKKLSALMDDETWMNAAKAVELGFCDGIIGKEAKPDEDPDDDDDDDDEKKTSDIAAAVQMPVIFSRRGYAEAVTNKIEGYIRAHAPAEPEEKHDDMRSADEMLERLRSLKDKF